ncbi:Hypothetical predicted protein [Pelobates cultripes]|uniref:Uncharacterized protein n=1 Tax=Pelobates cultripes TaxID=61616 RepID=A0AAD1SJ41_PELCU|nr:Hypothetical predicted protein [Pelobates cultripes]
MQEAQIRYRWQFPFALTAWRDDTEATIRSPQDVQAFQEALGLPQMPIADWTNCPINERFTGRPTRRHIQQGPNAEFTSLQERRSTTGRNKVMDNYTSHPTGPGHSYNINVHPYTTRERELPARRNQHCLRTPTGNRYVA